MTNQEPGAPEPLTSTVEIVEAELRPILQGRAEFIDGGWGVPMPFPDGPRVDEIDMADLARTLLRGLALRGAALSHPESDTRGLDVERPATALDNTPTRVFWRVKDGEDRQGLVREWAANISAAYARLSASPDLSTDREARDQSGRWARSGWHTLRCWQEWSATDATIDCTCAIRGTTQPEPTE